MARTAVIYFNNQLYGQVCPYDDKYRPGTVSTPLTSSPLLWMLNRSTGRRAFMAVYKLYRLTNRTQSVCSLADSVTVRPVGSHLFVQHATSVDVKHHDYLLSIPRSLPRKDRHFYFEEFLLCILCCHT